MNRKKHIFKLSQGEYIAPEKLENVYNKSSLISQIFVTGDSLKTYLVAIVNLNDPVCEQWADKNGVDPSTINEDPKMGEAILADFQERHKHAKLNGLEKIKKLHIAKEKFSVDNELLTPSLKLQRNNAKKEFKEIVAALYES